MQHIFVMWVQLEFDFTSSPGNKRKKVDYEALYEILKQRPITFSELMQLTGLNKHGVSQVITTLTLKYPVWSPAKGVYKLCTESDYQTVDWSKLNVE